MDGVDVSVYSPRMAVGQFDAVLNNWGLDPSPSGFRDQWHTAPVKSRGRNLQLYSNPIVDAAIDSAIVEWNAVRSRALYRRAYQQVTDDIAAVWLYENRSFMGINGRVQPDLTARDVWWRNLRRWSIPPANRLPRDAR